MITRGLVIPVVLCVAGLLSMAQAAGAAASGDADPSVYVAIDRASSFAGDALVGSTATITGSGWPADALLVIQICGNNALRGSSDCDLGGSVITATSTSGELWVAMTVAPPPVPCPCAVQVAVQAGDLSLLAPLSIYAHPDADLTPPQAAPPQPVVEVSEVEVDGWHSLPSFFGASPPRWLTLTVTNVGDTMSSPLLIELTVGKGVPTGFVPPFTMESLAPEERRDLRIELPMDAPAWGGYQVAGVLTGGAERVEFAVSTDSYPWGALLLLLVILQVPLFAVRNAVRRRAAWPDEPDSDGSATPLDSDSAAPDTADVSN